MRRWCTVSGLLSACILPLILGGCPNAPGALLGAAPPETTIVLTFDDGPLRSDAALPLHTSPDRLLAPLKTILTTLKLRQIRAVFYLQGPGDPASGETLRPDFAAGVAAVAAHGQVAGYHAYDPAAVFWSETLPDPALPGEMQSDLDELVSYLDSLLPAGTAPTSVFTPVFRQPFGGFGAGRVAGRQVAAARGWAYHGFDVDSLDWLGNADVAQPIRDVMYGTVYETLCAAVVQEQLSEQTVRLRARPSQPQATFDVLMHVNGFTSRHLDEWIDVLQRAATADGGVVHFEVPAAYLETGA